MINILLIVLLSVSFFTDVRKRKIYNVVTLPAIIIGISYYSITDNWNGFLYSSYGFLLGLGLLFIPFLMGGIGAGDVKLLAAVGALKGSAFVFYSFLYMGIVGGVISLFILLREKWIIHPIRQVLLAILLFKTNKKPLNFIDRKDLAPSFPYGVAIVVGAFSTLFLGGFI